MLLAHVGILILAVRYVPIIFSSEGGGLLMELVVKSFLTGDCSAHRLIIILPLILC